MTYGQCENVDVARRERLLPMGVASGCTLLRDRSRDDVLSYDDVRLPPGRLIDRLRAQQDELFFGSALAAPLTAPVDACGSRGRAMKVVILAGGYGTRISEESAVRPKPLVEIGGRPILWHIMKMYSAYGLNDFIDLLRLQGPSHQAILPRLYAGVRGRDLRPARQQDARPIATAWSRGA